MYYIYHIEGVKIGVSINPKQRVKGQGYSEYTILEQYEDAVIASEREIELQKQYGYPVDLMKYNPHQYKEMGKKGGSKNHKRTFGNATIEQRREWALIASKFSKKRLWVPILQYDKFNNFIKEWQSITEAANSVNSKPSNIVAVLKGREKSCKGFVWKYKD